MMKMSLHPERQKRGSFPVLEPLGSGGGNHESPVQCAVCVCVCVCVFVFVCMHVCACVSVDKKQGV